MVKEKSNNITVISFEDPEAINEERYTEEETEKNIQKEALINAIRCLTYYYQNNNKKMLDNIKILILENNIDIPLDLANNIGIDIYDLEINKQRTYYLNKLRGNQTRSELTMFYDNYRSFIKLVQYLTLKMYNGNNIILNENLKHINNNYVQSNNQETFYYDVINNLPEEIILFFRTVVYSNKKSTIECEDKTIRMYKEVRDFYIEALLSGCYSMFDDKNLCSIDWFGIPFGLRKCDKYNYIWIKSIASRPAFKEFLENEEDYFKNILEYYLNNGYPSSFVDGCCIKELINRFKKNIIKTK